MVSPVIPVLLPITNVAPAFISILQPLPSTVAPLKIKVPLFVNQMPFCVHVDCDLTPSFIMPNLNAFVLSLTLSPLTKNPLYQYVDDKVILAF
jgi:hypothetical protein